MYIRHTMKMLNTRRRRINVRTTFYAYPIVSLFRNSTTQKKKTAKAFSRERDVLLPASRHPETKNENKENAFPQQTTGNSRIPVPKPNQQKKVPSKTPYKTPKSLKKIATNTRSSAMKIDNNPKTPRAQELLIDQVEFFVFLLFRIGFFENL